MDLQKGFLISIIVALLYVAMRMLQPFLPYLLGATVVAFVLYPLHERLAPRIGSRISAGILVILTLVAAVMPVFLAVNAVVDDARSLAIDFEDSDLLKMEEIEQRIYELTGRDIDVATEIEDVLRGFVENTLGSISTVLDILKNLAIGLTISLFAIFYLLKDGKKFKAWLRDTVPMPDDIQDELYQKTYFTTWAVIKGHVLVAIAQGSIAGLGLFLVGIQGYAFWTFIMIMLAFIPIIGAFLVWGPAGAYLLMTGKPSAGAFLLIWGTVVVSLTDNFLRPLLVDREADLHPVVILIGVIGGLYVFGAAGIFMGPVSLGVLKSVLEVFKSNYDDL